MSKVEKLRQKLMRNPPPKDYRWDDWLTLAKAEGVEVSCDGGSHHIFTFSCCGYRFTMSRTHPQPLLKLYQIKEAIQALHHECKPLEKQGE